MVRSVPGRFQIASLSAALGLTLLGVGAAPAYAATDNGAAALGISMALGDGTLTVTCGAGGTVIYTPPADKDTGVLCSDVTSLTVTGTAEAETIDLRGVTADDFTQLPNTRVVAGDGDDIVEGSALPDNVDGEQGRDTIRGHGGDDGTVDGKCVSGDPTVGLRGANGDDVIEGGPGSDCLRGNGDADTLWGGDGPDHLEGGVGSDLLEWRMPDDRDIHDGVAGGELDTDRLLITGTSGPDSLTVSWDQDLLRGADFPDVVDNVATPDPNNRVEASTANIDEIEIELGDGDDVVVVDVDADLDGQDDTEGNAHDTDKHDGRNLDLVLVRGGAGNDTLDARQQEYEGGDDFGTPAPTAVSLHGEAGQDTLYGSIFADTLEGGSDDDRIVSGTALPQFGVETPDTVIGGAGAGDIIQVAGTSGGDDAQLDATSYQAGTTNATLTGVEQLNLTLFDGDDTFTVADLDGGELTGVVADGGGNADVLHVLDAAGPSDAGVVTQNGGQTITHSNFETHDTTAPDTTIDTGPSGTIALNTATFEFSSSEAGSTFSCRLDTGTWTTCTSPHQLNDLADGEHTFDVRATDTVGNTDPTPSSRTFTVDTAAPDTTIDTGPSGTIAVDTATFEFSSSEAGSTFSCRLDTGTWTTCTSPHQLNDLADGEHTFDVRATDTVGNTDPTPASRTFTVDTAAPDTTIDTGPSGTIAVDTATFEFSSSEAGSTFSCRLDTGTWTTCTSPHQLNDLADGEHTFDVRATDTVGNTDPTPSSRTFTVDTAAPDTTIDTGPSGTIAVDTATFEFSSSEAGSTFSCRLDTGTWTTCTSPHQLNDLADGEHTFDVRATDTVGNTDPTPASRTFTVDTAAPDTTIDTGPSGTIAVDTATFEFSSSEAGSTFSCRLDTGTWTTCTSPHQLNDLADGEHTFDVRATDTVGNTDPTPASRTWTVETPAAPPDDGDPTDPTDAPERLAGPTRYATAVAIALHQFPDGADTVYLARADNVVDAVAGGVLTDGPVLLVDSCGPLPDVVADALTTLAPAQVTALGGTTAICDDTLSAAGAHTGAPTDRLAGPTRYATAVAIALHQFPDGADTVYLARADNVVDAVAGGVLTDGPVLLVDSCGPLPDVVADALTTLAPAQVTALGGTTAICDDTLSAAGAHTGAPTDRLAGPTRYATAVAIALHQFPDGADTVYLARADNVVDAVAGGVLTDGPVLLVDSCGPLPDVVADALTTLAPAQVTALGGTTAICDDTLAQANP